MVEWSGHWAGIPLHRFRKLPTRWEIKVKPGMVIVRHELPELVTKGNQMVNGYAFTKDRKDRQRRRRAEQYKTVPSLKIGGEHHE